MASSLKTDMVNHPPHYTFGRFEVKDVLYSWFAHEALLWQVAKYVARCEHKDNYKQDLEKALFYVREAIIVENAHPESHVRPDSRFALDEVVDDWFFIEDAASYVHTLLRDVISDLYIAVYDSENYLKYLAHAEKSLVELIRLA